MQIQNCQQTTAGLTAVITRAVTRLIVITAVFLGQFTSAGWTGIGILMAVCAPTSVFAQAPVQTEEEALEHLRAESAKRGYTLTPADEQRIHLQYLQAMRMRELMNGQLPVGRPSAALAPAATPAAMTTDVLAARVATLPPAGPVDVVGAKDGFDISGSRVIDPEGRITSHSVNPATGDYTYVVQRSDGNRLIKRGRGKQGGGFLIGTAVGRTGSWSIRTVDGQALEGDAYALTPQGILVLRESAAFEWVAGQQVRSHAIPAAWTPVPFQRGDVTSTRYMLVEKSAEAQPKSGSLASIFEGTKRLVGTETPDDYALLNLDTGRVIKLAISVDDKKVTRMSNCRRKNAVVSQCDKATSFDSLWGTDGKPNLGHYFWRVLWLDTPNGPMAMSFQRGTTEVRLFDLQSDREVVAFRRAMGVTNWMARLTPAGKVSIDANWVFKSYRLDDARALLDTGVDMAGKAAEGTVIAGVPEGAEQAEVAASGQ